MRTQITQTVVVNGTPVDIETDISSPLERLIGEALKRAKYEDIPRNDWELKDAEGYIFPEHWIVAQARLAVTPGAKHGDKFFLCLRAGTGA